MTKVSVIGVGNLGGQIAYEIAKRDVCDELLLVDTAKDLAIGQKGDIEQGLVYKNNTQVSYGGYEDLSGSDIIVVVAGKPRTPDIKDRLELGKINASIISSVAAEIKKNSPDSIVMTITNPMDIMNYHLYKELGIDRRKIVGMGGQLDSSRFITVLSKGKPLDVQAYVIGEHGESQVPLWHNIKIAGEGKDYSDEEKEEIRLKVQTSAINVIGKKGATVFAPSSHTADMVEAILKDEKKLLICSCILDGEYGVSDVSVGVPCVLGSNGIEEILEWDLTEDEKKAFLDSSERVKKNIKEIVG